MTFGVTSWLWIVCSSHLLILCQAFSCIRYQKPVTDSTVLQLCTRKSENEDPTLLPQTLPSSRLTSWVVENLENDDDKITSASSSRAGENDVLPATGLKIGCTRIFAANTEVTTDHLLSRDEYPIRLLVGRNGWGTGVHPTTRLCLEWICQRVQPGNLLLDYGCGSGILSIAALHLGASRCIGVDIEAEALVTAERNIELNGFDGRFDGLHTREVLPYGLPPADMVVANILIGQLVRPSMVAALASNTNVNGLLCLSGIRPNEVDSLKYAYGEHFEWLDEDFGELAAQETEGSLDSYGFDCGTWARLVGRKKTNDRDIERMSELAIS